MAAGLYLGSSQIKNVYLGGTKAKKVYLGGTQIWSSATTITVAVAATADDGYCTATTLTTASRGLLVTSGDSDRAHERGFARFASLAIPAGATITSAVLTIGSFTLANGVLCSVHAASAANAAAPTTASGLLGTTLTTASASWSNASTSAPMNSPDLSAVIQEVIDLPGWTSGNALMFVTNNFTTTISSQFTMAADKAETLTVTYS